MGDIAQIARCQVNLMEGFTISALATLTVDATIDVVESEVGDTFFGGDFQINDTGITGYRSP